jgi:hypothetical protein
LAVVLVLAVPCGWLAAQLYQAKRQRDAAAAIEESGVEVGWSEPSGPLWLWDLLGNDLIDGRHVDSVQLLGDKGADAALRHLKALDQVERLDLMRSQVTDAGLENLEGLGRLQYLNLAQTRVTDAGLEHLRGLKQLETLHLEGTGVTEAGVKKLQQALPKCEIMLIPPRPAP